MALVLILGLLLGQDTQLGPVAMIVQVDGPATLTKSKGADSRKARLMDPVSPGDRLKCPADGKLVLVFPTTGSRILVKPNTEVVVGDAGCTPADAVEILQGKKQSSKLLVAGLKESISLTQSAASVVRGNPPIPNISPIADSFVLTERPTFSWLPVDGAKDYTLKLFDRRGRELWSMETTATSLAYPSAHQPLAVGQKFGWDVYSLENGKPKLQARADFTVTEMARHPELAEASELAKSTDLADQLLAALIYRNANVYGEALPLFEKLNQSRPSDNLIQKALVDLYQRAGRQRDAETTLAAMKKLEGAKPGKN